MMKQNRWFEILLVLIIMGISLYVALSDSQNLSWRWFTRDDAYYYFKVAQNISEGHGSTFDGMNPSNGYHPLWMLICIPIFTLARFDLILPLRVLLLVMGGFCAATAILFFRLIGRIFTPTIGAIAAIYWAFNYDILTRVYQPGLETGIAVFFVLLLVYKAFEFETTWRNAQVTNQQLFSLGLIATCAVLSRLDLIFLAGMVGIWVIFRKSPLRYLLPLDVAAILVSVMLAFIIRMQLPDYFRFADAAITMVAVSLVVRIPLLYFLGLYQSDILTKPSKLAVRLVIFLASSAALITGAMLVLARLEHFEGFPRITIVYDLGFTALFFVLSRFGAFGLKTNSSVMSEPITPLQYLRENWKLWITEGIAYYGIVGAGLALYMLSNKFLFGTFSPVSGQIKRWWGSLAGRVYGGPVGDPLSFFGINYVGDSNAWDPASNLLSTWAKNNSSYLIILAIFALLFYLLLYMNKQKAKSAIAQMSIVPLFASAWLQVLYYHAPGYSAYKEWYWVAQSVLVILVVSIIPGLLYQPVRKIRSAQSLAWVITLVVGYMMLPPFWANIRANMTYGEWKPTDPNNDIAAFLEAHTEPGSIIGMTGGGNAGYFIHDRIVINLDGLINSNEYYQLLKQQKAGPFLANEGLDYILANTGLLDQLPYKGQFDSYISLMDVRYGGKDLMHYRAP